MRIRGEISKAQAEAEEFMKRPIPRVPDLDRNLRKSYERGFFNNERFNDFRELKEKAIDKDNDSV
jgi:hypothetical protein